MLVRPGTTPPGDGLGPDLERRPGLQHVLRLARLLRAPGPVDLPRLPLAQERDEVAAPRRQWDVKQPCDDFKPGRKLEIRIVDCHSL